MLTCVQITLALLGVIAQSQTSTLTYIILFARNRAQINIPILIFWAGYRIFDV